MALVILDRDGVINYESINYVKSPQEWVPIPGSLAAIASLNHAGFKVYIATNQSGVARGLLDLATLLEIHDKLIQAVTEHGGHISGILYCPHHPAAYCQCRKPEPGMLLEIKSKHPEEFSQAFYIGDSLRDIEVAYRAGCQPILVLTGDGQQTLKSLPAQHQVPYFDNLANAAAYIIKSAL